MMEMEKKNEALIIQMKKSIAATGKTNVTPDKPKSKPGYDQVTPSINDDMDDMWSEFSESLFNH